MKVAAKRTATALCPDCEEEIDLGAAPKLGQKVICPHCDADLQVVSVKPLRLSWDDSEYEEEEEEWDVDEDW
jgi:lysine biosynthesis protein LysW